MKSLPPDLSRLRDLSWMTDATWKELSAPSIRGTHLQEIGVYLREDPANGRQLAHVVSHRLEKTVERLLALGASGDAQHYDRVEDGFFHPLDSAVSVSPYPWSERISCLLFEASSRPFSLRPVRPLLARALETPMATSWCLGKGADPDEVSASGYTALAAGAVSSDKHISLLVVRRSMRLLLKAGAKIDHLVPHPAAEGGSPCMSAASGAAWAGRWSMVRFLLASGANPDLGGPHSLRSQVSHAGFAPALRWLAIRDQIHLIGRTFAPRHAPHRGSRL